MSCRERFTFRVPILLLMCFICVNCRIGDEKLWAFDKKFKQVKIGMTSDQVLSLLGRPTSVSDPWTYSGPEADVLWHYQDEKAVVWWNVRFLNGKVVGKGRIDWKEI